jgi:hypothetical protein
MFTACSVKPQTIQKAHLRILPFLFALYVVAIDDESRAGDHQPAIWIVGRNLFLGYFLLEIPSNLLLHPIGARVWIARISCQLRCLFSQQACFYSRHS